MDATLITRACPTCSATVSVPPDASGAACPVCGARWPDDEALPAAACAWLADKRRATTAAAVGP